MRNFSRVFVLGIIFIVTEWICITNCSADIPISVEQEKDRVGKLPGQAFNTYFAHYSGYISVNDNSGASFFYWFFEAIDDPSSKPLAIWLDGAPGCSSIGYGEAEEIGPFHPTKDGKSIYLNPYSWTQVANIIFVESPSGVGFSYSNSTSDILAVGDKKVARENLAFILNWLERFPQYKGRDLYLLGELYAGHFVPQLARLILRHNSANDEIINLKGFMIGNPLLDDYHDQRGVFDFLYNIGIVSEKVQMMLKQACLHEPYLVASPECRQARSSALKEDGNLDYFSVFNPVCNFSSSSSEMLSKGFPMHNLKQKNPCFERYSVVYFNQPEVQEALHVRDSPVKWETCRYELRNAWKDSSRSILPTIKELIKGGLRIWVYSGNNDAVIPVPSTRYSLKALKLPTDGSHKPWYLDGQVGGWVEEYEGLTYVIVNGAGQEISLLKPKQALTLFKSYLSETPLSASKQFSDM